MCLGRHVCKQARRRRSPRDAGPCSAHMNTPQCPFANLSAVRSRRDPSPAAVGKTLLAMQSWPMQCLCVLPRGSVQVPVRGHGSAPSPRWAAHRGAAACVRQAARGRWPRSAAQHQALSCHPPTARAPPPPAAGTALRASPWPPVSARGRYGARCPRSHNSCG